MYRKLSEDKLQNIIDAGIAEFADEGFNGANLTRIAKAAGVSVGVIYKYYADKQALFLACVRHSLSALRDALKEVAFKSDDLKASIRSVVHTLIHHSKSNEYVNRMYHEITAGAASDFTKALSDEVEGISALVYTDLLRKAKDEGMCRQDLDPAMFAFFFDNLFMMIQFSYSCEYYRERIKLYCGNDILSDDARIEDELVKFLTGALGVRD
ncbi:MAG: TetR family transcriptional regulator [Lachnospiraceae bacterium]|nr:TetR family transcriptional regulator [Lachnospiraceae bacterium]